MKPNDGSERALPAVSLEPLQRRDPRALGDYRLLGRLGTGGMGVAFLAEGPEDWVVVKMVRSDLADDSSFRFRLARELEAMRLVEGPHTARLFAEDLDDEVPWFAMEFIPGLTLARRIVDIGPMPADEATLFAGDLCEALESIHQAGITHRDLKPGNIMLSPSGPRLIDFGIAEVSDATQLTRTGTVLGSTGWLSPEQITGDPVGPATDVHAWALCILYAFTGQQPFGGSSSPATMYRVIEVTPDVPSFIDEPVRSLLLAALAKDSAKRPTLDRIRHELGRELKQAPSIGEDSAVEVCEPSSPADSSSEASVEATNLELELSVVPGSNDAPRAVSLADPSPELQKPARPVADGGPSGGKGQSVGRWPVRNTMALLAGAVLLTGSLGFMLLGGRGGTAEVVPPPPGSADQQLPATSDATPSSPSSPVAPVPATPTYSVAVDYAGADLPDSVFKDSLDWTADLCLSDLEVLKPSLASKVRLYRRVSGSWSAVDTKPSIARGGRCGEDAVNVLFSSAATAPDLKSADEGWTPCKDYRVLVPETSKYRKTGVDFCVKTRADL